jgi:hypothetical protein
MKFYVTRWARRGALNLLKLRTLTIAAAWL